MGGGVFNSNSSNFLVGCWGEIHTLWLKSDSDSWVILLLVESWSLCFTNERSDTQCWLLLGLKICLLRHYHAGQHSRLQLVSVFRLYFSNLCIKVFYSKVPAQVHQNYDQSEIFMSFLWKILWEWDGNRVDTFGRKASKHYLIFVYIFCLHDQPWQQPLFRIWCTEQFVYTAALHFQKGFIFIPQISFNLFILKEPCFFGSFPLAALVGNLCEHLSLAADPCLTDST